MVVWQVGILSTMGLQWQAERIERLGVLLNLRMSQPEMLTSRFILYVREVQIFNVGNVAKALPVLLERTVMIER